MVIVGKVKRGEMDRNRGSMGVLEGMGKKTVKIRGAQLC